MKTGMSCVVLAAAALAGCAQMEVKRTAEHAQAKADYLAGVQHAEPFDGLRDCTRRPGLAAWDRTEFTPASPALRVPNGVRAAAFCVAVPDGASVLQIATDSHGGMTFHQTRVVRPSLLFLDADFDIVRDEERPRMHYNSRMTTSGLDGTIALAEIPGARYLVVYVHPMALDSGVKVDAQHFQTTVPFNPYGVVRLRFHATP